jgi:hypothetical protein
MRKDPEMSVYDRWMKGAREFKAPSIRDYPFVAFDRDNTITEVFDVIDGDTLALVYRMDWELHMWIDARGTSTRPWVVRDEDWSYLGSYATRKAAEAAVERYYSDRKLSIGDEGPSGPGVMDGRMLVKMPYPGRPRAGSAEELTATFAEMMDEDDFREKILGAADTTKKSPVRFGLPFPADTDTDPDSSSDPDNDDDDDLPVPPRPEELASDETFSEFFGTPIPPSEEYYGPHSSHLSDALGTFRATCETCRAMAQTAVRQAGGELEMAQHWRVRHARGRVLYFSNSFDAQREVDINGGSLETSLQTRWVKTGFS